MTWTTRQIDTDAGNYLIHERGQGPPVVMYLHDHLSTQPPKLAELLAKEARVVAPVLPGFGNAPRPDWVESVRDLGDYLHAWLDTSGLEHCVIVGSSLGAWVAVELALRAPAMVDALVLLSPLGLHVPDAPIADHWMVEGEDRDALFFADSSAIPNVDLEEYIANDESAARYGWSPRFADPTLEPRVSRLRVPVALIRGADDRFVPEEHHRRWQQLLGPTTVEQIPQAGHLVAHEQPERIADIVARCTTARAGGPTA